MYDRFLLQFIDNRSQVNVLAILKQPKSLANAKLNLALGPNTLLRGLGYFRIGEAITCEG